MLKNLSGGLEGKCCQTFEKQTFVQIRPEAGALLMLRWNPGYWDFVQVFVFFSFPAENATDFLHLLGATDGGAFSDICLAEGRPLKRREETLSVWKSLFGGIMSQFCRSAVNTLREDPNNAPNMRRRGGEV